MSDTKPGSAGGGGGGFVPVQGRDPKRAKYPMSIQPTYGEPMDLDRLGTTITEQGIVTFDTLVNKKAFQDRVKDGQCHPELLDERYSGTKFSASNFNIQRHMALYRVIQMKKNPKTLAYEHVRDAGIGSTLVCGAYNNKRKDQDYRFLGFAAATWIGTPGTGQYTITPDTLACNTQGTCTWWAGQERIKAGDWVYLDDPPVSYSDSMHCAVPQMNMPGIEKGTFLPVYRPLRFKEHGHPSNMVANLQSMIFDGDLKKAEMFRRRWELMLLTARVGTTPSNTMFAEMSELDRGCASPEDIKQNVEMILAALQKHLDNATIEMAMYMKLELMKAIEDQTGHYDFYLNRVVGKATKPANPGQKFDVLWK